MPLETGAYTAILPKPKQEEITMDARTSTMMLHCGAHACSIDDVANVVTPPPTETHFPVPHIQIYEQLMDRLMESGLRIVNEQHALQTKNEVEGANWFALTEMESEREDYNLVVGARNSHVMLYSSAFALGRRVFICDNLSISAEFVLKRKHTRNIKRDLPQVIARSVGGLMDARVTQDKRIAAYKAKELPLIDADHAIMDLARARVIAANKVIPVWQEFETPSYDEHLNDDGERTVWTLHNAVTEVYKGTSVFTLLRRGQALDGICDSTAGIASVEDAIEGDFEVVSAAAA